MTGFPDIMLALGTLDEAAQALVFAERIEFIHPSGQDLVYIGLMAHIENHLVTRAVKAIVQGQREFNHSQIRCKMATGNGQLFD